MMSRTLIIVILLVLVAGSVVFISQKLNPSGSTTNTNQRKALPTALPVSQLRGKITSVSATSMTIEVKNGGKETVTFSQSTVVQRLTSGDVEKGNVKTTKAQVSDLTVGKDVLVITGKGDLVAQAVLIVK